MEPSYNSLSTQMPLITNGAKPVFIDIKRDTLNWLRYFFQNLITKKTNWNDNSCPLCRRFV